MLQVTIVIVCSSMVNIVYIFLAWHKRPFLSKVGMLPLTTLQLHRCFHEVSSRKKAAVGGAKEQLADQCTCPCL